VTSSWLLVLLAAQVGTSSTSTEARLPETIVRAPRLLRPSAATSLTGEEGKRLPGTEGDPLKAVEDLGGVARSTLGSGGLIVWGAAPEETKVELDGVEIPALYHLGGFRSVVHPGMVGAFQLVPGGAGPEHGRGLGGLIEIDSSRAPPGMHADLAADLLDGAALISAEAGPVHFRAAGRKSWLDRTLNLAGDLGAFFPIPRYDDHQVEAALDLGQRRELRLLWLGSDDHLTRSVSSSDPAEVRSDSTDRSFERVILRYSDLPRDGVRVTVAPFFGWDQRTDRTLFLEQPTELSVTSWVFGMRAAYRRRLPIDGTLEVGLDALATRSIVHRQGSLALPPREGDLFVFGQPPGPDVNEDDYYVWVANAAPYVDLGVDLGPLRLRPGIRFDAFALDGSRLLPRSGAAPPLGFSRLDLAPEPRLSARLRVLPELDLEAGAGVYRRPPAPEDLSAVFGTPTLGPSSATHVLAGAETRPTPGLRIEAIGFWEELGDLAARSPLPTPSLAQALTESGSGRSLGLELTARVELAFLFVSASYTLSRSERHDVPAGPVRLSDYDQTHLLSAVASAVRGEWTFGARFRFATGFPRTPVESAFFDATLDRYEPIFGAHNSIRIPDFYAFDLRVDRSFDLGGVFVSAYLELQNLTNHTNAEEIVYRQDFRQRELITGLPALAVLGLEVKL
jgi:hypothetical protein